MILFATRATKSHNMKQFSVVNSVFHFFVVSIIFWVSTLALSEAKTKPRRPSFTITSKRDSKTSTTVADTDIERYCLLFKLIFNYVFLRNNLEFVKLRQCLILIN